MAEEDLKSQLSWIENKIREGRVEEVLAPLLRAISAEPTVVAPRILLAKVFYEMELLPLAVRELQDLRAMMPESKYPVRLLERLAPDVLGAMRGDSSIKDEVGEVYKSEKGEEVLSEVELDTDKIMDR